MYYHLTRIDISTHPERVAHYRRLGYDADAGMIIDIDGVIYHGAMALTVLDSLLVTDRWRHRVLVMIVKYKRIAEMVYPVLLLVRKVMRRGNRSD